MTTAAGQPAASGRVPGERIETTPITSTVAFASETVVASVTAHLITGRTYAIHFRGNFFITSGGGTARLRLREDDSSGTVIDDVRVPLSVNNSVQGAKGFVYNEHEALSTADKTFVVTAEQTAGGGNTALAGASDRVAYLTADYLYG